LYRHGLGWLLGDRFLMLTHKGRKSGLPRQVVLEVVAHHPDTGEYIIASGWGDRADWYLNILKTPVVWVRVGRRRFQAIAEPLSHDKAQREIEDYARRHPIAFRQLGGLLFGTITRSGLTSDALDAFVQAVPLVALHPVRR
jgi:deazaflavin-dependent oxidoreductase (nitroreductase family)